MLLLGRRAHRLELAGDCGRTCAGGLRDHAGDVAGTLFGCSERLIEQPGEARQALVEIGGAQVDGGDERFQRLLALGERGGGVLVALLHDLRGLDEGLAVRVELRRQFAEILKRPRSLRVEDVELVFQVLRRSAVARGDVVHRRDEVGDARHQRPLERVEVVVCTGQHLLEEDVAFAQTLEQGDRVGAQDLAGLLHLGDGRNRDLARLVDRRTRGRLEVLERPADRAGRDLARRIDGAGDFVAVAHHGLREGRAAGLDRLQRVGGDAVDIERELAGLRADRVHERAALGVDHVARRSACCCT